MRILLLLGFFLLGHQAGLFISDYEDETFLQRYLVCRHIEASNSIECAHASDEARPMWEKLLTYRLFK